MYLVYLDESGDDGVGGRSPTQYLVVGALLVRPETWLSTLDDIIRFRRWLKGKFGIPMKADLKGNALLNGAPPFDRTPPRQRIWIYARVQDLIRSLPVKVFAVAIDKVKAQQRGWTPRKAAWTFSFQRINRYCQPGSASQIPDLALIIPDEGQTNYVQKRLRAMRRYHTVTPFYGGSRIRSDVRQVIEDPSERKSQNSYFVQLADFVAHSAHRSHHVDERPNTGNLWDRLEEVRILEVNDLRNTMAPQPPGIVKWP